MLEQRDRFLRTCTSILLPCLCWVWTSPFCAVADVSPTCGVVGQLHATLPTSPTGSSRGQSQVGTRSRRLVGGEVVAPWEFPWQVRLRSFGRDTYSGVLVGYNWVLTAASCFDEYVLGGGARNYAPSVWNVVLGDTDTTRLEGTERSVFVDSIFIYGGFNKSGHMKNDLALVKLRPDQVTSLDIQFAPVCLPEEGEQHNNSTCYITGWGALTKDGGSSSRLRKLRVSLINSTECSERFAITAGAEYLCAGARDLSSGPCTGDRGSPVLCHYDDKWTVAGIVSQPFACGPDQTPPGMFVNVAHSSTWINKIISKF